MGPDGDLRFTAGAPAVAHDSGSGRWLVVWAGNAASDRREIWGRLLTPKGRAIGPQRRLSQMAGGAARPSVAYNHAAGEYLVVWWGDRAGNGEHEIFGQRVSAAGDELGPDFRISSTGPDGDPRFGAFVPRVAANYRRGEYLVVWSGDTATGEREIFGQRLRADGAELGADEVRLSHAGPDGDARFRAEFPDVAYNERDDEYLVVWAADAAVDNEFEVYGRRLSARGVVLDEQDRRMTDVGPRGDPRFAARTPALAYGAGRKEYLLVWWAETQTDEEFEIFARRLAASARPAAEAFRISRTGAEGDTAASALVPDVAYRAAGREYVVVWWGDPGETPLEDNEREVYAHRVPEGGRTSPVPGARLSRMGPDGEYLFAAVDPAVASGDAGYLVAWLGDEPGPPLADNDFEVFVRRIAPR